MKQDGGNKMKKLGWAVSWFLGAFFLLDGILYFVDKEHLSSIPLFMMALLLLPPIRRFVHSKTNFKFPLYARVISIIILFMIFKNISDREHVEYFKNNSVSVIAQINALIKSGDYEKALSMSKKYLKSGNKELADLHRMAKTKTNELEVEKAGQPITEMGKKVYKEILLRKIMKVHSKWLLIKEKEIDNNKLIIMASNPVYPPLRPIWLFENGKIYSINGAAKTVTPEFPFTYIIDPVNAVEILEENKPYRAISHETETVRNTKPTPPIYGREVIGRWREEMPWNCVTEIYKEKNKYYLASKFDEGGLATQELTKYGKNIFKRVDSRAGDYYVITKDNYLESKDNDGLISTAKPVK